MKYHKETIDGYEVNYSPDWIYDLEEPAHFMWYYEQAKLVYNNCLRTENLLEIGIGTGLLSDLLKKRGWRIKTLDIDKEKKPDFCSNALEFDYKQSNANTILAFEIFEHIPFSTFKKILNRFSHNNINKIYFSVPWNEQVLFDISIKLPKFKRIEHTISYPRKTITTKTHHWELSKTRKTLDQKILVPMAELKEVFSKNGYMLRSEKKTESIQFLSATRD